jgi:peptide/nickel transport system substrate-binding protein
MATRAPLIHDPRFTRNEFLKLTAAGVAAAGLAGTGIDSALARSGDAPKRGGILRLGQTGDVKSFDGPTISDNNSIWTMLLIYDQLTRPTEDGRSVEPSLAQSWDISADGKTYTFHLRPGVKFHDGSPVTAEDVKFSVERAAFLKASQWSFIFTGFKSMEVVDAHTVRAHLSAPRAPFLSDVALFAASVLPKKLVESMGEQKFFQNPIGTGPFMFKSWAKGSEIIFTRNPHHFRAPQPYVDEYHQLLVPDANTRVLQVQNGELDIALFVSPASAGSLLGNSNVTLHRDNFFDSHFVTIQTQSKPFLGDKLVRQAMNYAIDKEAIVKHFIFGFGSPAGQALPNMFGASPSVKPYPYDMNKAKALLAKSKFPNGFTTTLFVDASYAAPDKQIAEYIQSQFKQLGITVNITVLNDAAHLAATQSPKFEMDVGYMTSDIVDPDELMSFAVAPHGGTNAIWTYYQNPKIDTLVSQAASILDHKQRQKIYDQINTIHHDDAPMIFLYWATSLSVSSSKVQGFKVLPTGNFRVEQCWFSS